MRLRSEPLPRLLISDLVAIARLLFRTWRAERAPRHKLRELASVGQRLQHALELSQMPVATVEHARAWRLAEEATEDLGRLVGSEQRTLTLITAAFSRLDRPERSSIFQEREAARLRQRRLRS